LEAWYSLEVASFISSITVVEELTIEVAWSKKYGPLQTETKDLTERLSLACLTAHKDVQQMKFSIESIQT
jgi:hypothetical protein